MRRFLVIASVVFLLVFSGVQIEAQTSIPAGVYNLTPGFESTCLDDYSCDNDPSIVGSHQPDFLHIIFCNTNPDCDTRMNDNRLFATVIENTSGLGCAHDPLGRCMVIEGFVGCDRPRHIYVIVTPLNTPPLCSVKYPGKECVHVAVYRSVWVGGRLERQYLNAIPMFARVFPIGDCKGYEYPFPYWLCWGDEEHPAHNFGIHFVYKLAVAEKPPLHYHTEVFYDPVAIALQKGVVGERKEGSSHEFLADTNYQIGLKIDPQSPKVRVWYRPFNCNVKEKKDGSVIYNCQHGEPKFIEVSNPSYIINIVDGQIGPAKVVPVTLAKVGDYFEAFPVDWKLGSTQTPNIYSQRRVSLGGINVLDPLGVSYAAKTIFSGTAIIPDAFCQTKDGTTECVGDLAHYYKEFVHYFGFDVKVHHQTRSK